MTNHKQYLKLAAIIDTTKKLQRPLELRIRGTGAKPGDDLVLAVVQRVSAKRGAAWRNLATAPFDPSNPDAAAEDVARQLTLDGKLPSTLE